MKITLLRSMVFVILVISASSCQSIEQKFEAEPIQAVRQYHKTINSINEGTSSSDDLYQYVTADAVWRNVGYFEKIFAGGIRYDDMKYKMISQSDNCATVNGKGKMMRDGESFDEDYDYTVVKINSVWKVGFRCTDVDY